MVARKEVAGMVEVEEVMAYCRVAATIHGTEDSGGGGGAAQDGHREGVEVHAPREGHDMAHSWR